MSSARFLFGVAPALLIVVLAHLALLQHETGVVASSLSHLDYVAKKGETKADKRGARTPTVKKDLEPEEEVLGVELEEADDEDEQLEAGGKPKEVKKLTIKPAEKTQSGDLSGKAWLNTEKLGAAESKSRSSLKKEEQSENEDAKDTDEEGDKVDNDDGNDNDDGEEKLIDPLGRGEKGKKKEKNDGARGGSRSDIFDLEEKEEGNAPMIVLKIHPVDSGKKKAGQVGTVKPTLSPSMDKLVHDNNGKTGPNGTVVITIKPDLSAIAKLNKTGELEQFGTVVMERNSSSSTSSVTSTSTSQIKIDNTGSVIESSGGSTTKVPMFRLSTTSKPTSKPSNRPTSKSMGKQTSKSTIKPASKTTGKPSSKPTIKSASKTTNKPTNKLTSKPTSKSPSKTTSKPRNKATGKPTSKSTIKPAATTPASIKIITDSLPKSWTTAKTGTVKPLNTTPTPSNSTLCPCMTAKPGSSDQLTNQKPGASLKSTSKPAAKAQTSGKPDVTKGNLAMAAAASGAAPHCTARPDCQCNYQELKDTDKMLAVVITNRGGFKGRRLNSKAIGEIMAGKVSMQQMLDIQKQQSITVSTNNTYVLPAGHYYFPHPVRFAGFLSA